MKSLIALLLTVLTIVGPLLPAGWGGGFSLLPSVIVFDSTQDTTCNCGAFPCNYCGTMSWSHTIGTGAYPILIVGVTFPSFPVTYIVSVLYRSSSCSGSYCDHQLSFVNGVIGYSDEVEVFYLWGGQLSPGTSTITVVFLGYPEKVVAGSVSYFNVWRIGSPTGNHGGHGEADVTVNANVGDVVVDVLAMLSNSVPVPGAGQGQVWDRVVSSVVGAASNAPALSSQVTMTWGPGESDWAIVGFPLRPVGAGGRGGGVGEELMPVGGVVVPTNNFAIMSPWLAVIGLVGCIATVVVMSSRWKKPEN